MASQRCCADVFRLLVTNFVVTPRPIAGSGNGACAVLSLIIFSLGRGPGYRGQFLRTCMKTRTRARVTLAHLSRYVHADTQWRPRQCPLAIIGAACGSGRNFEACCSWLLVFGGGSLRMSGDPASNRTSFTPRSVSVKGRNLLRSAGDVGLACFVVFY